MEEPPKEQEKPKDPPEVDPAQAFLGAKLTPEQEAIFGAEHKGLPAWEQAVKHATPDLQKLMGNVRTWAQRSVAEAERKAKEADARDGASKTALAQAQEQLAALGGPDFTRHLQELAKGAEGADPFTPEGRAKIEKARFAEHFNEMMTPVRTQLEGEARRAKFDAYLAANPDLREDGLKAEVGALLKRHDHLTLEDAHQLARGARAIKRVAELEAQLGAEKKIRGETLADTGPSGIRGGAGKPRRFKSAVEAFEYHRSQGME